MKPLIVNLLVTTLTKLYELNKVNPAFPNELNDSFNPYEVNLIKYVNFTKGCYIGQEVIARLDTYEKVKFNFAGFILDRDYNFEDKIIYKKDLTGIGELTSKTYSPNLKAFIGLGIYNKKLSEEELTDIYLRENDELIKIRKTNLPMVNL